MDQAPSPTGLSPTGMVVPYVQPGALSQAWYDALGLARNRPATAAAPPPPTLTAMGRRVTVPPPATDLRPAGTFVTEGSSLTGSASRRGRVTPETLWRPVRLLNRIRTLRLQASVQPPQSDLIAHSAGRVTIIANRQRVRLLVQQLGGEMRITAVCDPRLLGDIDAALRSAHLRLAARGLRISHRTHGEVAG